MVKMNNKMQKIENNFDESENEIIKKLAIESAFFMVAVIILILIFAVSLSTIATAICFVIYMMIIVTSSFRISELLVIHKELMIIKQLAISEYNNQRKRNVQKA